jgi:hypothetical protein
VKTTPTKEEIENLGGEFGKKIKHDKEAYWIKNQCQQNAMEWSPISEMEVTLVPRMMHNWKVPGRDQMANLWLKQLTAKHTH